MANDHEASTSKDKHRDAKYTQPKWCPPGLSKNKKRRLQHMRNQQKVEQEVEKQRDECFNEIRPMAPIKQVWRPKQIENPATSTSIKATPISSKEDGVIIVTSPITHIPHPLHLKKL